MRIALYQPEIAGNVGAILRLAACFDVAVDIIEPCGFAFSDRALKRAGMDYATHVPVTRHADWAAFESSVPGRRILLTTHGDTRLDTMRFAADDVLVMGSESSGVPAEVHDRADHRVLIPIRQGMRSFNIAVATAIGLWEAARQTGGLPE